jgi:hypothetical protein
VSSAESKGRVARGASPREALLVKKRKKDNAKIERTQKPKKIFGSSIFLYSIRYTIKS